MLQQVEKWPMIQDGVGFVIVPFERPLNAYLLGIAMLPCALSCDA